MPRRPTVRRPPDSLPPASPTTALPPPTASAPPASERVSASAHALPLSQQRHCQTRLPSAPTPPQDPALLVYIPQDRSTNCRARSYFHCAPMSPTRPTMSCSCNNKTNVVSTTRPTLYQTTSATGPDVEPWLIVAHVVATAYVVAPEGLVWVHLLMNLDIALTRIRIITKYNDALLILRCFHTVS
jgi:hypothetical protein